MNKPAVFSTLLVLTECLFFGIGNVLVNIVLQTMPIILCLALRLSISCFLFLCFFRIRIKTTLNKKHILPCIIIAAVSTAAFLTSMLSLKYCSATTASFLISLSVAFAPLFAFLILRTKIDIKIIFPILIITIGLYYLCGGNVEFKFGFGEVMGLTCSACYALLIALSEKHLMGIDATVISFFQSAFGAVSCLILSFLLEDVTIIFRLTAINWYSVIFLSVFSTFTAFLCQNYALKNLSSTYVSILFCLESVSSAVFAFIIIGERLTLSEAAGTIFVLIGIVAASVIGGQKKTSLAAHHHENS